MSKSIRNLHPTAFAAFTALLVLSATLGLASKQTLQAKVYEDSKLPSTATQSIGDAIGGVSSMGDAPSGTSSMGTTGADTPNPPANPQPTPTSPSGSSKPRENTPAGDATAPVLTVVDNPAIEQTVEQTEVAVAQGQPPVANAVPQVVSSAAVTPEPLPTTGPSGLVGLATGSGLAGFAGHKLYLRRKR